MAERDPEIAAIEAVVGALKDLDADARDRVLSYVAQRLDLAAVVSSPALVEPDGTPEPLPEPVGVGRVTDIRSLREEKNPTTDNEMAAIVAYYLSELAPADEQKSEVTRADLEKYFKQAGHPLPTGTGIKFTLRNASQAGYFDVLGGGRYKLNPVGHNLVAHALPSGGSPGAKRSSGRKRASGRKRISAKKSARKRAAKPKTK